MRSEDRRWVDNLAADSRCFEQACRELHAFLQRVARLEVRQYAVTVRVSGPEADDLACQAASDALLLIIGKAGQFRGESKFTTWASRFASLEVRAKLRQYLARPGQLAPQQRQEQWDYLADPVPGPDHEAEARALAQAVRHVVDTRLTRAQRAAFEGVVLAGGTPEVVAATLGTNANAVYQAVFRARQSLRQELALGGFFP